MATESRTFSHHSSAVVNVSHASCTEIIAQQEVAEVEGVILRGSACASNSVSDTGKERKEEEANVENEFVTRVNHKIVSKIKIRGY